jgi:serine/threonine protein kinase
MKESTELVLKDLHLDSEFFCRNENPSRVSPRFGLEEVQVGPELGRGEFGIVFQVEALPLANCNKCRCAKCEGVSPADTTCDSVLARLDTSRLPPPPPPKSIILQPPVASSPGMPRRKNSCVTFQGLDDANDGSTDDTEHLEDNISDLDELSVADEPEGLDEACMVRGQMSAQVMRNGDARYAIKRLRNGIDGQKQIDAAIDLACEAQFLATITHPNIVRLRGTVNTPGEPGFMFIMDRLYDTLDVKIRGWKSVARKSRGTLGFLRRNHKALDSLMAERLVAAFEIASAMRHLHKNKILYRDLKPENIGIDVRGNYKIFDFGLAKELKAKDLVKAPDGYEATGLTGTRRYMAPEVIRCAPYGFSADVYGFGILFWQMISLKTPFEKYDTNKLYDHVVVAGKRPEAVHGLPSMLHSMMEDAWSVETSKRPTFKQICQYLQAEIADTNSVNPSALMNRSLISLYHHEKEN